MILCYVCLIDDSCSPNLMNYLVLVESMDCQLAHIGFYASRDVRNSAHSLIFFSCLSFKYGYKDFVTTGRVCLIVRSL